MTAAWSGKTYWLIGASEGLGRALARQLAAEGARLCLSARSEERLQDLAREIGAGAIAAPLDLTRPESMAAAFAELPPLDGVIFCAGAYEPVAATEWRADAVELMFDVNLLGAARALGHVVPAMVKRGRGHIVLIGSLAGIVGLPGTIGYGSSKAGLMHLAECLRADLPPDAFKVQVVNPGFIETRLTAKNDFKMPLMLSPEDAATRTRRLMEGRSFRGYFPRRFAALFRAARLLPDWLYFRLV